MNNDLVGIYLAKKRTNAVLKFCEGIVLDIGCGSNRLVKQYHGLGIGIDVYPWPNVDVIVKNSAILPFPDKYFDTVTIVAALNHIPNRITTIRETKRILKDNGKFIVTIAGPKIGRVWHFVRKPWDKDQTERGMVEGETWGINENDFRKILDEIGFEIIVKESFNLGINKVLVSKKK